jgi:hypothetical protein
VSLYQMVGLYICYDEDFSLEKSYYKELISGATKCLELYVFEIVYNNIHIIFISFKKKTTIQF